MWDSKWDSNKILVVDDVPANLEVLTETLSSADYTVATAISGERALKRLETYVPNLILLDVQMPGIDGFETCRQIKTNPDTASIPIIFITALSDTESIVKGFSLGGVDYISKPFREPELLARVKTHLQMQQVNQTLEEHVAKRTHELKDALTQLRESQLQLIQQEKMSALGNLVAGVAHELNNPIGSVSANLKELKQNLDDVFEHLSLHQKQVPDEALASHADEIDLEFLLGDMPKMVASMENGCDRIRNISTSLRTFSRADQDDKTNFNLHDGLDSTLLILKHRLKANELRPAIEVTKLYGELPDIRCFPGQLNQVFMNILANAIDALEESSQGKSFQDIQSQPNQITIKTALVGEQVCIYLRDNGVGMPQDVQERIFDHLYTTKAVGKGTGLGLEIAKQIIIEKHKGQITVESAPQQGTEFILTLPVERVEA